MILVAETTTSIPGPDTAKQIKDVGYDRLIVGLVESALASSCSTSFPVNGADMTLNKLLCVDSLHESLQGTEEISLTTHVNPVI